MRNSLSKSLINKAIRHLTSSDKILSDFIIKHGPCLIKPSIDNPFHALASSIISQQISARAARAIKGRLFALLGTERMTPKKILKLSPKNFRAIGLSRPKSKYIRELALAVKKGDLDFPSISNSDDEIVIEKLTAFSGIGKWTAEMFLIFGLGRPDVLSTNDAGLRKGFKILYGLQDIPSPEEMISIGEPWRPYRSVASWYLWRVVD